MTIYRFIPHLITVMGFVLGFSAIHQAISGNFELAMYFIMLASFFDFFDGRLARAMNVDGRFGVELDSLCDMLAFGVAPVFVVMHYQNPENGLLYLASIFFSVAAVLRLARFNISVGSAKAKYFTGLPAPVAALLALWPIMAYLSYGFVFYDTFYALYLVILGVLMVSNIPTFSLKGYKLANIISVILLLMLFTVLILHTWETMFFIGIVYVLCMPYVWFLHYKVNKRQKNSD